LLVSSRSVKVLENSEEKETNLEDAGDVVHGLDHPHISTKTVLNQFLGHIGRGGTSGLKTAKSMEVSALLKLLAGLMHRDGAYLLLQPQLHSRPATSPHHTKAYGS
jgi:hypothetical protein